MIIIITVKKSRKVLLKVRNYFHKLMTNKFENFIRKLDVKIITGVKISQR